MIGVGYEGRTLEEFLEGLRTAGVTRVVDVRLNPVSRKPGFGKRALAAALGETGIAYEHMPALGNPKANRAGFSGGESELAQARAVFAELLRRPEAVRAIERLIGLAQAEVVAVMCFEVDQSRCHRDLVLEAADGDSLPA